MLQSADNAPQLAYLHRLQKEHAVPSLFAGAGLMASLVLSQRCQLPHHGCTNTHTVAQVAQLKQHPAASQEMSIFTDNPKSLYTRLDTAIRLDTRQKAELLPNL